MTAASAPRLLLRREALGTTLAQAGALLSAGIAVSSTTADARDLRRIGAISLAPIGGMEATTRITAPEGITDVAWTPDGNAIAVRQGAGNQRINIYDVRSKNLLVSIDGAGISQRRNSICFTNNGRELLSNAPRKVERQKYCGAIWHVETGRPVRLIPRALREGLIVEDNFHHVRETPDGRYVVAACRVNREPAIVIFRVADFAIHDVLISSRDEAYFPPIALRNDCFAFRILRPRDPFDASYRCEIALYDPERRKIAKIFHKYLTGIHSMAWRPHTKTLALGAGGTGLPTPGFGPPDLVDELSYRLALVDVDEERVIAVNRQSIGVVSVDWSPDGRWLCTRSGEPNRERGPMFAWIDLETMRGTATYTHSPSMYFNGMALSPTRKQILFAKNETAHVLSLV